MLGPSRPRDTKSIREQEGNSGEGYKTESIISINCDLSYEHLNLCI